jgi:hypothetical protein
MVRRIGMRNEQQRNRKKKQASQLVSEKHAEIYCAAFINRIRMNSFC